MKSPREKFSVSPPVLAADTPQPVTAAKEDSMYLKVLTDASGGKLAARLYKDYISEEDHARFPAFVYTLDQMLVEFGGRPLPPEEDEEKPGPDRTDTAEAPPEADEEEVAEDEENEEEDEDEPVDPDWEEDAQLRNDPYTASLTNELRAGLVLAQQPSQLGTEEVTAAGKPEYIIRHELPGEYHGEIHKRKGGFHPVLFHKGKKVDSAEAHATTDTAKSALNEMHKDHEWEHNPRVNRDAKK